ncbi:MAG TPA: efflux RND transporter periplasmic adaptor subunit [Gammaproteobacteria bacterium]|nr:efflux RND transporter periplasmic adaptor subunit [Gammaproteobacteria bacterium]
MYYRGLWPVILSLALLSPATAQVPVSVVEPETGRASQTLSLSGSLIARQSARLSPQVAGLVADMVVDAGDRVAAGDVLVRLDARMARLEEARALAEVDETLAARAEAERLRDEGRRLVESNFVPDTEVQAREAAMLQADAALARARSELAIVRQRLAQHVIAAPFDGVVSQRLAEAGEWVATGTAVLELVTVDDLWLDVRVPQQYWTRIDAGTQLVAFADPAPDTPLDVRLHARVPVNDPAARTFLLRLLVHDETGGITPGMSARVQISLPGTSAVTLVPRDAIIRYPDGTTTIWIVETADGREVARQHQVELLRVVGERAELAGELEPGRRVIIRGNEVLSEGEPVRIVER